MITPEVEEWLQLDAQCGFASASIGHGVGMSRELQWQKLELLKDVAKSIWTQG